jgi:hypothetical protein
VNFKDMSVNTKLISGFVVVLVITVLLGLFGNYSMSRVNDASIDVRVNWMPSIGYLGKYQYAMSRFRVFQANYLMTTTDAERDTIRKGMDERLALASSSWAQYVPTIVPPEERALSEKILAARAEFDAMGLKLIEIFDSQGEHRLWQRCRKEGGGSLSGGTADGVRCYRTCCSVGLHRGLNPHPGHFRAAQADDRRHGRAGEGQSQHQSTVR